MKSLQQLSRSDQQVGCRHNTKIRTNILPHLGIDSPQSLRNADRFGGISFHQVYGSNIGRDPPRSIVCLPKRICFYETMSYTQVLDEDQNRSLLLPPVVVESVREG